MKFCVITPTAGLDVFARKSDHHMVLAHQFVKDKAYAAFYKERSRRGDFIFLDNGVYEGDYNPESFVWAISELQPSVAVLPDVICKGIESTARSITFLDQYGKEFPLVNWMFIPQGEHIEEWHNSFDDFRYILKSTPFWVGLTRFLPTHTCKNNWRIRAKLARMIKQRLPNTPIHCMGMFNGSVKELRHLAQSEVVDSIDSSAPVWRGWNNRSLKRPRDKTWWNRKGTEVDFTASLPSDGTLQKIEQNLTEIRKALYA